MDVINPDKLCVNLFKGFDFTGGQTFHFSIGNWRRRYNSAALPRSLWYGQNTSCMGGFGTNEKFVQSPAFAVLQHGHLELMLVVNAVFCRLLCVVCFTVFVELFHSGRGKLAGKCLSHIPNIHLHTETWGSSLTCHTAAVYSTADAIGSSILLMAVSPYDPHNDQGLCACGPRWDDFTTKTICHILVYSWCYTVAVWGESVVSRKAVDGVGKPCGIKHLNFILETAHLGANDVICVRKIFRVPIPEVGALACPIRIRHWLQ